MKKILLITCVIVLSSLALTSCIFGFQSALGKITFDIEGTILDGLNVPLTITVESKDTSKIVLAESGKSPSDKVTIKLYSGTTKSTSGMLDFTWFGYHQKVENMEFKVAVESSIPVESAPKGEKTYKSTIEAGKFNKITFNFGNINDWL